jgi:hypothetical protein
MGRGAEAAALLARAGADAARSLVVGDGDAPAVRVVADALGCDSVDVVAADAVDRSRLPRCAQVVVDVSGSDAVAAFAVVRAALDLQRAGQFSGELLLVAVDYPAEAASDHEETAALLGDGEMTEGRDRLGGDPSWRVWLPILSEGRVNALARLHHVVAPDHICPVVPFPSRVARRGDDLLLEYRRSFLEPLRVDLAQVVYAHESDPFDLYRSLGALRDRDPHAVVIVSPAAPCFPALGAMLAAYEFGVALVWADLAADAEGATSAATGSGVSVVDVRDELVCIWLEGEPYRSMAVEARA